MTEATPWTVIEVHRKGHVAELMLNRPQARNALDSALFREISDALEALDADPEVRAIVIYGAGPSFCAGLDLGAALAELGPKLQGGGAGPREELRKHIKLLQHQTGAPARIATPVIAAVHGWCIGGGLDLIAACDIRLASADARFSLRETRIAIVADIGSLQRLPRIVGDAVTREWALTGRDFEADEGLRRGLLTRVLPDQAALMAEARRLAKEIAALPPLTVKGVKQVLNYNDGKSIEAGLDYVAAWNSAFLPSEDLAEAIAAWFEKRPPVYKGA